MAKKLELIFLILVAVLSFSMAAETLSETELIREARSPQQYQNLLYYPPPTQRPQMFRVRRSIDESEAELIREARSPQRFTTLLYHPPPQPVKVYRARRLADESQAELVREARSPKLYQTLPFNDRSQFQNLPYHYPNDNIGIIERVPYYYPQRNPDGKLRLVRRSIDELENVDQDKPKLFPNPRPLTWPTLAPHEQT